MGRRVTMLRDACAWVAVPLLRVAPDVAGLGGFGLAIAGVRRLWGDGWAMIVAGVVVFGFYVWRELRLARSRRTDASS